RRRSPGHPRRVVQGAGRRPVRPDAVRGRHRGSAGAQVRHRQGGAAHRLHRHRRGDPGASARGGRPPARSPGGVGRGEGGGPVSTGDRPPEGPEQDAAETPRPDGGTPTDTDGGSPTDTDGGSPEEGRAGATDTGAGGPGVELGRLHPLTPVLKGWKVLAIVVAAVGQDALREFDLRLFGLQLLAAMFIGLVLGLLSWWFTKYRIEGDVLRVESGFVFRRSRRIRLDRLQAVDIVRPVLARLLGLAELRLEVAGGASTEAPLAYLTEPAAQRLRAELLARAAGLEADAPEAPEARLVSVPPGALFASTILSAPFLVSALGFVAVSAASLWIGEIVGFALLVPWALGGIGVVWQQFV